MKKHWMALSVLALMAVSGGASLARAAEEPNIRITSFRGAGRGSDGFNNLMAEICGNVSGMGTQEFSVRVTSDPGNDPGTYMTSTDERGNFCHAILTWTRRAQVEIWVPGKGAVATASVAK